MGAEPLIDVCLCDEQDRNGGSEAAYSRWAETFFAAPVSSIFSLDAQKTQFKKYKIEYLKDNDEMKEIKGSQEVPASENDPFYAELVGNTRVTFEDHWQDVRLIEIECGSMKKRIGYECGDVCVMRPANTKANVEKFLQTFEHLNLGFLILI